MEKIKHNSRVFDLYIRLPKNQKHLKVDLAEIAKKNNVSLTRIVLDAIEYYLGKRQRKVFHK